MSADMTLPPLLGVMALPAVSLFPGTFLPLYIFEPRYRAMLADALETQRMFAVVGLKSSDADSGVFDVGGVGLIRACVSNVDGTSNLILQGLSRVRFTDWLDGAPHRIARVDALQSTVEPGKYTEDLRRHILKHCEERHGAGESLPQYFTAALAADMDLDEFADLVGAVLVEDGAVRQRLMEELSVTRRLEILADYLT